MRKGSAKTTDEVKFAVFGYIRTKSNAIRVKNHPQMPMQSVKLVSVSSFQRSAFKRNMLFFCLGYGQIGCHWILSLDWSESRLGITCKCIESKPILEFIIIIFFAVYAARWIRWIRFVGFSKMHI